MTSLKLCILQDLHDKSTIYAGYKLTSHTKWVTSKLPQVSKTEIKNSNEILLLDSVDSLNASHLRTILRCHSIEPFAAICNFLCSDAMIGEDTLIEFAGKFATAEVMTFFIDYFKIEVFQRNKSSLLESAIKHNPNVDTILLILKHLPRIENLELPGIQTVKYNREQLIALCLYNSIEISLSREDTDVFNILLRFGVKLDNPYGKDAGTILHLMATKSASKFVIPLLDWLGKSNRTIAFKNVRFIDAQNNFGETALYLFVKAELIPQIKLILNLSPNLSLTDHNDDNILHIAVQTKSLTALSILIAEVKKANCQSLLNLKNTIGLKPLHIAIENTSLGISEHLVQSGSSLFLALHHVLKLRIASKRIEFINLFLEKERENHEGDITFLTSAQDMCKRTPLHLAVINQFEETVELLLRVDPFVLLLTDKHEKTPLHLATPCQNLKIIKMITNAIQVHSATYDWEKENILSMQDFENKTALHLCIEYQNSGALVILLEAIPYLDLNDKDGNSLLHYAVRYPEDGTCIELLLERLTEKFPETMSRYLYAENNDKIPPLQFAILNDHLKGAQTLIGYQVNLAYDSTPDCSSLCHGKLGLTIEFLQREGGSEVGSYEYFAGMKIGTDSWIACSLPDLKSTTLFSTKQVELVKTFLLEILRSRSIETFTAALNSKLNYFTLDARFKDGRQLKHLIAQHASRQVMSHFLTLYTGPVYNCENGVMSMVEYAVLNRTDPKTLELLLQTIRNEDNPMYNEQYSISIDSCFQRAFILSLENNDIPKSVFELLLKYTPKVDYRFTHNNTLLHIIIGNSKDSSFIEVLFTKLKNTGNLLLNNSPFVDAQNIDFRTALHACIELGQLENMKTLLTYSPDLGKQDRDLNTVLLLAVMQDRLEFVGALVEQCSKNIIDSKNRAGLAPIHYAVKNGNCLMTRLLLHSNADRFTTDNDGRNILHHAIANVDSFTRKQLVKCILINDAGIMQERSDEETPTLTLMRDMRGYSPLHLAVLLQSVNVIRILLNSDPQALFLRDHNMHTPLHLSVIPGIQIMEKTDPFYSLCKPTFVDEIFNEIFEFINIEDKHEFGVHCNMNNVICYQDHKKRTAMHYAIQYNYPHALGRLLKTGSCLDIRDDKGENLMHEAIGNPDSGVCLDLLTNEMNERSKYR